MIAAPEGAADTHVEVLSQLATMVIDPDFKEALIAAPTVERFLELVTAKEQGNFDPSVEGFIKTAEDQKATSITDAIEAKAAEAIEKVAPKISVDNPHYDVLAVTGCPTGIAHTYMAAESLERKAKEMGISLKVEKKISLEEKIKIILNNLMHKDDFVNRVEIIVNEDILDINLYDKEESIINKGKLSKGEQQLYASSLLQAFIEESQMKFPIFIDSPLQKFDKIHANKIITEFYPVISEQVILFPLLGKELSKKEFEIMKPYINSVYKIKNQADFSYIEKLSDINNLIS